MQYFTLNELTRSGTADALKIANRPNEVQKGNLVHLVETCLDPLRKIWGQPIIVNSGFRCKELNKAVGGSASSQHMKGEAADIRPQKLEDIEKLFMLARHLPHYDQLLLERRGGSKKNRWIHISCKRELSANRHQCISDYIA